MGGAYVAIVVLVAGLVIGYGLAVLEFTNQAYERGYMVECLGKGGYYWECED